MKIYLLCFLLVFSQLAISQNGGGDRVGGGGADLTKEFVKEAEKVIRRIREDAKNQKGNEKDKRNKVANILSTALSSGVEPILVDVITHPETKEVLKHFDAWSDDQHIQLRNDKWSLYLSPKFLGKFDYLIAHELFRVAETLNANAQSKNAVDLNDDGYRLSSNWLKLDRPDSSHARFLNQEATNQELINNLIIPGSDDWQAQIYNLYTLASADLETIQQLLQNEDYAQALAMARKFKTNLLSKTGVNPKVRGEIQIKVNNLLTLTEIELPYSSLKRESQANILAVIEDYKFGTFIDLLNLLKRAYALEQQALYYQSKNITNQAPLLDAVKENLINNALAAMNIGIELYDQKTGLTYLVFDHEVASTNYQFLYNLEITQWILSIEEFGLTEKELENKSKNFRQEKVNNLLASTEHLRNYTKDQCLKILKKAINIQAKKSGYYPNEKKLGEITEHFFNLRSNLSKNYIDSVVYELSLSDGWYVEPKFYFSEETKEKNFWYELKKYR
jgi:hypothetical protein